MSDKKILLIVALSIVTILFMLKIVIDLLLLGGFKVILLIGAIWLVAKTIEPINKFLSK